MSIWDILGINCTTDIALIKSAYAKKAKEYHPEEFPEEFQKLQKAYKSAVKYAKQNKNAAVYSKVEHLQTEKLQTDNIKADNIKADNIKTDSQKSIHLETEDKKKKEQDFNYDEVELMDVKEQFWFEFYNIAENPYLMNNIKCWQYFLEQQQYQPLYKQENFIQSFIDNVCFLSGWYFKTIRFFNHWLNDAKLQKRKRNLWWKFKCISFWAGWLHLVEICKTAEQKQLHETITMKMKRMGEEDLKLKSEEAVALYLQLYFEYCEKNNHLVHKRYKENNSRRAMVISILISLIFFIWISAGASQTMREKQMEERNQKNYEEKMKNYKRYRKYRNDNIQSKDSTTDEIYQSNKE